MTGAQRPSNKGAVLSSDRGWNPGGTLGVAACHKRRGGECCRAEWGAGGDQQLRLEDGKGACGTCHSHLEKTLDNTLDNNNHLENYQALIS